MTNNGEHPVPDDRSLRIQNIAEQRSALTWVETEYNLLRAQGLARLEGLDSVADIARLALGKLLDEYDAANDNTLANEASAKLVEQAEREEELLRQHPDLPRL